jgi:hypothetical protein
MIFRSRCTHQLIKQEGTMDVMTLCFSFFHQALLRQTVTAWKQLRRHIIYREIPWDTRLK